jgi:biotin--protein ligase
MISQFVWEGGCYIGICAGGYYGASRVVFDQGGLLEVVALRELGFFPGEAVGPLFGPFIYDSEEGARYVSISWQDRGTQPRWISAYYNGGCMFLNVERESVDVWSYYQTYQQAAVVACSWGRGQAVLSGVHPEYTPYSPLFERMYGL